MSPKPSRKVLRRITFALIHLIAIGSLHRLYSQRALPEPRLPQGSYSQERIETMATRYACHLFPAGSDLQVTSELTQRTLLKERRKEWLAQCAFEREGRRYYFIWDAERNALMQVTANLPAAPASGRALTAEQAADYGKIWLQHLEMNAPDAHWRLQQAQLVEKAVWYVTFKRGSEEARFKIEARSGELRQMLYRPVASNESAVPSRSIG